MSLDVLRIIGVRCYIACMNSTRQSATWNYNIRRPLDRVYGGVYVGPNSLGKVVGVECVVVNLLQRERELYPSPPPSPSNARPFAF